MKQAFAVMSLGWVVVAGALAPAVAHAGVFNLPRFVPVGTFAGGIEPELTLTNGAGLGVNAKFQTGITDFSNAHAIIGTGAGPRRFRVGGAVTFDLFPDLPEQPGIGIAARGIYYRLPSTGLFEVSAVPYVHKTFVANDNEIEPFLAFPIGLNFSEGKYKASSTIAIGSMFKNSENFRYVMEFGMAINNAESTISGGVIYYP